MKVLETYDPADTESWLRIRLRGLGGSDAAAIMGEDDWRGPFDVWNDRVNPESRLASGMGEAAYWGTVLEKIVAQEFAERKSVEWDSNVGVSEIHVVYQHETVPCMLATIDRLVYANFEMEPRGGLEVKTRSAYTAKDWDAGVPRKVWWQVQHYLAVTGLRDYWVAVLIGGQRYHDYTVARDDAAIAELELRCKALWCKVESREAPPLDGSKAQRDMLDAVEAKEGTSIRVRSNDWELKGDLADYQSITAQIKNLEKDLRGVKARIQGRFGDAEFLVNESGERMARWAVTETERFDAKSFREDHPDLAGPYLVRSSHRTLTVKGVE